MLLMAGSMFIVSYQYPDLYETYRKYWTLIAGGPVIAFYAFNRTVSHEAILHSIVFLGILECGYALLQLCRIIPSYNSFFAYTGSFDNPAVFALVLSVCIPIAVWLAIHNRSKHVWSGIAGLMLLFTAFTESRSGLLASVGASAIVCIMENRRIRWLCLRIGIPLAVIMAAGLYFFKADSANGRLLIWRVSMSMLKDRPLLGWGPDGFSAMYMTYQANYLAANPDSPFILLADNPANPFNVFIAVLVNFGLTGLVVSVAIIALVAVRLYRSSLEHRSLLLGLVFALVVWGMFSYPHSLPYVWVIAAYAVSCAIPKQKAAYCIAGLTLTIFSIIRFIPEREWKQASELSIQGQTLEMLPRFEALSDRLSSNPRFMYNWAAELHFAHRYAESAEVFDRNLCRMNDYDVQMLLADDCQNMHMDSLALHHYDIAASMVPSKFLPHYYKMKLFLERSDTASALQVAEYIVNKPVKVSKSRSVQTIIHEATDLLDLHNNQLN